MTYRWFAALALGAVLLSLAAFSCMRALQPRELALREDDARSVRLVTYAVPLGAAVRLPIDPGSEVLRVVVHAFRRGILSKGEHRARWRLGERETLEVIATGSSGRIVPEEQGLEVGDPVAFNIDAHGTAAELTLTLEAIADADGMLVRVYRRESLVESDSLQRHTSLSLAKREHVAVRAGELDWVDLSANERETLLSSHWQKVAPLPIPDRPLRALAVQMFPSQFDSSAVVASSPEPVPAADQAAVLVEFDRVNPLRPAIVQALDTPLVLRVRARLPSLVSDSSSNALRIALDIVDGPVAFSSVVEREVPSAPLDHYEDSTETRVPSEAATFYVLLPAHGKATLRPVSGDADLSFAELDESPEAGVFAARRPTNWASFAPTAHGRLRVAHRAPPPKDGPSAHPVDHVLRPRGVHVSYENGRAFVPASTPLAFHVEAGVAGDLYVRLHSDVGADVRVVVDGALPQRRRAGVADSVTSARTQHVDGDSGFAFHVGTDLAPGQHVLSFQGAGPDLLVHLPWQKAARAPHPQQAAWLAGDFAP